jgi:hypothetical protein
MSLTIRPVPAMEPSQALFLAFGEGGTTSATGSPNLVTRIGLRVLRTRSRTARQVALNLEIAISSMMQPGYLYHSQGPWSTGPAEKRILSCVPSRLDLTLLAPLPKVSIEAGCGWTPAFQWCRRRLRVGLRMEVTMARSKGSRKTDDDIARPNDETAGEVLADGSVLELVGDSVETKQPHLLRWDGQNAIVCEQFECDGKTYVPARLDSSVLKAPPYSF